MDSFKEILPEKEIHSYALGNKKNTTSFIISNVIDDRKGIVYYPVFLNHWEEKWSKLGISL